MKKNGRRRRKPWHRIMREYRRGFADILDPFYESPLQFPESDTVNLDRGRIFRFAWLTMRQGVAFGEFEVLGKDLAARIGRAWRPREVHLLEHLSRAFSEVIHRAGRQIIVPDVHIRRATDAAVRYYDYLGLPRDVGSIESKVRKLVDSTSRLARDLGQHFDG